MAAIPTAVPVETKIALESEALQRQVLNMLKAQDTRGVTALLVNNAKKGIFIDTQIVLIAYNIVRTLAEYVEQAELELAFPFVKESLQTALELKQLQELFIEVASMKTGPRGAVNTLVKKKAEGEQVPLFIVKELHKILSDLNEGADAATLEEAFPEIKPKPVLISSGPGAMSTGYPVQPDGLLPEPGASPAP